MFLDDVTSNEDQCVSLSKLLASCLVIRGAQLSVVKRLDNQFVVSIHTTLISWICKRIASSEANGNKKARNKAILLFKALVPLLNSIDALDSLRM